MILCETPEQREVPNTHFTRSSDGVFTARLGIDFSGRSRLPPDVTQAADVVPSANPPTKFARRFDVSMVSQVCTGRDCYRAMILASDREVRSDIGKLMLSYPCIACEDTDDSVIVALSSLPFAQPDLVFLSGHLGEKAEPAVINRGEETSIIVVSPDRRHAALAFDIGAVDFLHVPIVPERFSLAISRFLERHGAAHDSLFNGDYLFHRENGHLEVVQVPRIKYITADHTYSVLHMGDGREIRSHQSISVWHDRLQRRNFARIHRSVIVNLDFVEQIEEWSNYAYRVHLVDCEDPLPMSRGWAARLKARFV